MIGTPDTMLRPRTWGQDCSRLLQELCEQSLGQLLSGLGGHNEDRQFGCGRYSTVLLPIGPQLIENRSLERTLRGSRPYFPSGVNQNFSAKWEI